MNLAPTGKNCLRENERKEAPDGFINRQGLYLPYIREGHKVMVQGESLLTD
jgi:hypothetical protein